MKSAEYLYSAISRAEVDFSRVIGQCFCLKAFKMRILTDLNRQETLTVLTLDIVLSIGWHYFCRG